MNPENKHQWKEVKVNERLLDTFDKQWNCVRCNCERLRSKYDGFFIYSREKIIFSTRPDCFGSVPINLQTID